MANASLLQSLVGPQKPKDLFTSLLLKGALDSSPVQHWSQGLGRMAQALLAGAEMGEQDRNEREAPQAVLGILNQGQQGGHPQGPITSGPRPQNAPPLITPQPGTPNARVADAFSAMQPQGNMAAYGSSIANIESGGRYDAMGPVTKTGDRAHGKYQVMGANIGPWSEAAIGRRVTPQEFLSNPQIQDAVFQHRFGQYVQRHGPEGAARAWFAGEGGMNDPNRRDQLGTTVSSYAQRFNSGLPQVAQAQGAPPQGAPQPQQAPQTPQIPPHVVQMINHKNPNVRNYGIGLLQEFMKPRDYDIKTENGVTIAVNKRDPRDRHVIDDPAASKALIDHEGRKSYTTTYNTERAKKDVVEPDRRPQRERSGNIVVQDIDRALAGVNAPGLPSTGPTAAMNRYVPGTNAFNLDSLLTTIKSNAGFDRLQQMREASPTGGALGAVTERELDLLQSAIGNLDPRQDKAQFVDNLRRVKNIYLDIIHGPNQGPPRDRLSFEQQPQPQQQPQQSAGVTVPWQQYFGGR